MRKALVVGINYYAHGAALYGCVDDAHAVKSVLERNSDRRSDSVRSNQRRPQRGHYDSYCVDC